MKLPNRTIHCPARGLIEGRRHRHRVFFLGTKPAPRGVDPNEALASLLHRDRETPHAVAWNRQVHSNRVETVSHPAAGVAEADALFTTEAGLALAVFTADCVPVLVAGGRETAAIHAGWRGLMASIIARTLELFEEPRDQLVAWIGPSMGVCCYEVGPRVAWEVASTSGPDVVDSARGAKPHLDLAGAAAEQLLREGVSDLRLSSRCTGCSEGEWWSYRRGAVREERNLTFIWRDS